MNVSGGICSSGGDNKKPAILAMLDSTALSPCHEFSRSATKQEVMSVTSLHDLLLLVTRYEAGELPMVISVGSVKALTPAILKALQRLDCEWIVPRKIASVLGCDDTSTVVVALDAEGGAVDAASNTHVQYVLFHVSPQNVATFAQTLRENLGTSYSVTLRAKNLDQYEERDFLNYERQLAALAEEILKGADCSGGRCFCPNLCSREAPRCGAGTTLLTAAPDGLIYPCPAFYHAGRSHALASVHELLDEPGWGKRIQQLCRDLDCRACAFLSRAQNGKAEQACRFSAAEALARRQLPHYAVRSRRLWRGFCSLETVASQVRTQLECDAAQTPVVQTYDVGTDLLRQALVDVQTLAAYAWSANGLSEEIWQRWRPLDGVPSGSRLAVFRARVLEIVEELLQLRDARKSSALRDNDAWNRDAHGNTADTSTSNVCLRLSAEEIENIHGRHAVYMGWRALVISSQRDKADGFDCGEPSWMETQLRSSRIAVDEWFHEARQRYGLHADDGWTCEVNFEKGSLDVSSPCSSSQMCLATGFASQNPLLEKQRETMALSDKDLQFIYALLELRNALIDTFRSQYRDAQTANAKRERTRALLHELGDVSMGISAWYGQKARAMGWVPTASWTIDMQEKMLVLTHDSESDASRRG